MVEFPSFSKWMRERDLFTQAEIGMMIKFVLPFMIFIVGNGFAKSYRLPNDQALIIPMFAGVSVFIMAFWWDTMNRNNSTQYLPLNLTLAWSPTFADEITTTITDFAILAENAEEQIYKYMIKFDMSLKDDKGEKFQHAIIRAHYPMDRTFRKVPRQFIAFGGSVFMGMSSRFVATFMDEYEDIEGFSQEEMKMANFKVFDVDWCLEDSKNKQAKIGLYRENMTAVEVKEIKQDEIERKSVRLAMENRELRGKIASYDDAFVDAGTKAKEIVNRYIDIQERIKRERNLVTRLLRDKWVRWLLILGLVGLGIYLLRFYKVI